ncbi:MAG: hypothetical protein OEW90_01820 [Betaproteobacteria bacterium]|nr:hypothetical protein [Betaproteobacteria bacterium]MDH5210099.1 hypothetical protein [Betaproteobacteria bacterium]
MNAEVSSEAPMERGLPDRFLTTLQRIPFHMSERDGRITISPLWPHRVRPNGGTAYMGARDWGVIKHDEHPPSATASAARSAESIAKEFDRRFMAKYIPMFQACLAKRKQIAENDERAMQLATQMAASLGIAKPGVEYRDGEAHFWHPNARVVRIWCGEQEPRARIESLTTSAAKMQRILEILGTN